MILYYNGYVIEGTVEEIDQFIRNNTPTSVSGGADKYNVTEPTLSNYTNEKDHQLIEAYKKGRTPKSVMDNCANNGGVVK